MPAYDYQCPKCGAIKEVYASMSEVSTLEVRCDECGVIMNRKFHPVVAIWKTPTPIMIKKAEEQTERLEHILDETPTTDDYKRYQDTKSKLEDKWGKKLP